MKALLCSLFITGLLIAVSPTPVDASAVRTHNSKNVTVKRTRVLLSFKVATGAGFQYNALYSLTNATTGTFGIPLSDGITTQVAVQEGDIIDLKGYQIWGRQFVVTAALVAAGGATL